MILWHNGRLCDAADLRIDPRDRGLTLGDGVFETMRAMSGRVPWLARHERRLRVGLAVLGIEPPPLPDRAALSALLAANALADGVVRLTVTRGPGARGLDPPEQPRPTVLVTAGHYHPPAAQVTAVIARDTRRNGASPLARIKSLNYLDNILARQEAVRRGAEEALLCDRDGGVLCASAANLLLYRDGQYVTPDPASGALAGTALAVLSEALPIIPSRVTADDLAAAELILLTNALGVRWIRRLDDHPVGNPAAQGIFHKIQEVISTSLRNEE